ncbi:hypothetical protein [Mesorhizobium sp.]|nr:hypothetical protein [Mesorhizobium sp.]RWJ31934.1 MAG: hypothetical protein EOR28_14250 [Mesorhizobium sp.]
MEAKVSGADEAAKSLPTTTRSVTKSYATVVALKGMNLYIRSGEFMTLLGHCGSGKTTPPRRMFGSLPGQVDPTIAAISTCLIAGSVRPIPISQFARARSQK